MDYGNNREVNEDAITLAAQTTGQSSSRKKRHIWDTMSCSKTFNPPELGDPRYECIVEHTSYSKYVRFRERSEDEMAAASAGSASTAVEDARNCSALLERNNTLLQQLVQQEPEGEEEEEKCSVDNSDGNNDDDKDDELEDDGTGSDTKYSVEDLRFQTLLETEFDITMKSALGMLLWIKDIGLTSVGFDFLYKVTVKYLSFHLGSVSPELLWGGQDSFYLFREALNSLVRLDCADHYFWAQGDISVVEATDLGMHGKLFPDIARFVPPEPSCNWSFHQSLKNLLVLEARDAPPRETESIVCPAKDLYEILLEGQARTTTNLVSNLMSKGYSEDQEKSIRRGISVLLQTCIAVEEDNGFISVNPSFQFPFPVFLNSVMATCSICSDPIGGDLNDLVSITNPCCSGMFHRGCVLRNWPIGFSGVWCPTCHSPIVLD